MARKDIRVLHESTSISPTAAEFPPSTKYVKLVHLLYKISFRTMVIAKRTKISEFSFELSVKEGEILELDTQLISDDLKKAVMENGSLPTDWLVCLTPIGEKRLIRRHLVKRVDETQARMLQLQKASNKLLESLFHKQCTTEIGAEIHELIGNSKVLMNYFVDQLLEALKNADSPRMKAMAAYALNHYMFTETNHDLVSYVETKIEDIAKFVDNFRCDQSCSPELISAVSKMLDEWCRHFDPKSGNLTQLSNLLVDINFQKAMDKIISGDLSETKGREKILEAVQRVVMQYLKKEEKTEELLKYLVNQMKVQEIYKAHWKQFDESRIFAQWLLPQKPVPPPKPTIIQIPTVKPEPKSVHQVKKRTRHTARKHCFSHATDSVLNVMESYIQEFEYTELEEIRKLGRGSFGYTLLVKTPAFGVPTVAKVLLPGRSLTYNAEKELANLLKCASHPHIVTIHGKIVIDREPIGLLMEYMEGGSLFDVIYSRMEDYSELQLLIWMDHVASALLFLHPRNLIHRDIKPGNLLLAEKNGQRIMKLGDFGSMKALKDTEKATEAKTFEGTRGYVAPEINPLDEEELGNYSTAIDIYSFGITIWEMVQRRRPDKAENLVFNGSRTIANLRPDLINPKYSWMPPLVTRMWHADPTLRPPIEEIHNEINKLHELLNE